jgi:hypothetical protein
VKSHKAPKLRQANREKKPTPWGGVVCRSLETGRCGGGTACSGPATPALGQRLVDVGDLVAEACATWAFPTSTGP